MRVGSNRFQLVNPTSGLACLSQCNGKCGSTYRLTPNQSVFLADRDDLTIPALGTSPLAPFPLQRHNYVRADFVKEAFPLRVTVASTAMIRIRAAGSPGNHFWNGNGNTSEPLNSVSGFYEAAGSPGLSNVTSVGGISGFKSDRRGPIVGVFTRGPEVEYPKYLTPPATINFVAPYNQVQTMFPAIRQVFCAFATNFDTISWILFTYLFVHQTLETVRFPTTSAAPSMFLLEPSICILDTLTLGHSLVLPARTRTTMASLLWSSIASAEL
jgi:hypothetical protein